MDAILEYLTLKITAREFLNRVMHEDAVYDRIQSKIPQSRFAYDEEWKESPVCAEAFQYDDFDLRRTLSTGYYSLVRSQRCAAAYKMIFSLFRNEYPNIVYNTYYDQISKIAIDIVPECVDSMEAGEILFECINQAMDLSPEERRKRIQSEIKKAFHLEKNGKRPRWIQASQWPVEDGIPLKFISQKETGDQVEYQFMDVRNQKKRVITQFY